MSEELDFTYKAQSVNNRRGCTKTRDCVIVFVMTYYSVSRKFPYKLRKRWAMCILFVQKVSWLVWVLLVNLQNVDETALADSYMRRQASCIFCRTQSHNNLHLCWRIFMCFRVWCTDQLHRQQDLSFLISWYVTILFRGSRRPKVAKCVIKKEGDGNRQPRPRRTIFNKLEWCQIGIRLRLL